MQVSSDSQFLHAHGVGEAGEQQDPQTGDVGSTSSGEGIQCKARLRRVPHANRNADGEKVKGLGFRVYPEP